MRLTVLMPTLNEVEGLRRTLERLPKDALREAGYELHVLIVDGLSKDGTPELASRMGALVIVEPRLGYGRAYKTGFTNAPGDLVVTVDADDTYPVDHLVEYLRVFREQKLDFATLDRFSVMEPGSMSRKHKFGNWVLSTGARTLFGIRLHDSQSGMWILSRRALDRIPFESFSEGMAFSQELKIWAMKDKGMRSTELPGRYYPRAGEAKLASWKDGLRNLRKLAGFRMRRRAAARANR